jgi:hypothetical protein
MKTHYTHTREDSIKIYLREVELGDMNWIEQ